jgi:hypothetical protein
MKLIFLPVLVAVSIILAQKKASSEPTEVRIATAWDPRKVASAAYWAAAKEKGDRLICRLEATDEAAGRQFEDTRNPPSARSQWTDVTLMNELPR